MDLVAHGVDMAIRAGRLEDSSLIARPLTQLPELLVAAPGYLAQYGAAERIEDLARHRIIAFEPFAHPSQLNLLDERGASHSVQLSIGAKTDSVEVVGQLAILGMGIARLPRTAVAEAVQERRHERSAGAFPWVTELLHERLLARFRHPPLWADAQCTGCGVCREVCPVENIVMDGMHRPQWLQQCEGCFACVAWCPSRAIQVGRFSRGLPRYHHPDVSLEEMRGVRRGTSLKRFSQEGIGVGER